MEDEVEVEEVVEEPGLMDKAKSALGLGDAPEENAPVATAKAKEPSAAEKKAVRKAAIQKNMGKNLGDKKVRIAKARAATIE